MRCLKGDNMGNPTVMKIENLKQMWKCNDCSNTDEFEEDWSVEIVQDINKRARWFELAESMDIRCKKCKSYDVEEVEV